MLSGAADEASGLINPLSCNQTSFFGTYDVLQGFFSEKVPTPLAQQTNGGRAGARALVMTMIMCVCVHVKQTMTIHLFTDKRE